MQWVANQPYVHRRLDSDAKTDPAPWVRTSPTRARLDSGHPWIHRL